MTTLGAISVERWTRASRVSGVAVTMLVVIFAFGPLLFGANMRGQAHHAIHLCHVGGDVERAGRICRPSLGRTASILWTGRLFCDPAGRARPSALSVADGRCPALRPFRPSPLLFHAAPAWRRVLDRHVGGGRGAPSAGQSRQAGSRRDRHLAHLAQCLYPRVTQGL